MNLQLEYYERGLPDMERAEMLNYRAPKLYFEKAIAKRAITDYEGALGDLNLAVTMDPQSGQYRHARGSLLQLLGQQDSACADFREAQRLGYERAKRKVEECGEQPDKPVYPLLRLTRQATSRKYGFDGDHPVKVGQGPDGGPANQQTYLRLLRDAQGRPVRYTRAGSCCAYKSKNAWIGDHALVDRYEVTYLNERGKEETTSVYISFYDYEEPKILHGFSTVKPVQDTRR